MKKTKLLLLLFWGSAILCSQTLTCLKPENAYLDGKKKLRGRKKISVKNHFILVKKGGKINLRYENRPSDELKEGRYNLDSCYKHYKKIYDKHDSVYKVLVEKNLNDCMNKFEYGCRTAAIMRNRIPDSLKTLYDSSMGGHIVIREIRDLAIKTKANNYTLNWKHPETYNGLYYVVIRNFYDEYLDIFYTPHNSLNLNLAHYIKEGRILIKIISEECRESEDIYINME